jgi:hypothetical protein
MGLGKRLATHLIMSGIAGNLDVKAGALLYYIVA